jgi:desampylase
MIDAIHLPEALRAQIEREARAASPRECCGLVEGHHAADGAIVTAIHPARNLSDNPRRFEIDPAEHIRLQREMRGTARAIIGCYHSHPNGIAVPSERDRAAAMDENFVWLVCALNGQGAQIGSFVFENGRFRALEALQAASA